MWFKLSLLILRNRVLIISLIAILTSYFGFIAFTSLETDNKYGNTLPRESPAQADYQKFKDMFGEEGGTLVIAVQPEDLYTENNFLIWKKLSDSISKIPGVESVISEAGLFTIHNNKELKKFEVETIFKDDTYQEKSIDEIKEQIRRVPLYNGLLYNDSTNVSLMMVNIDEEYLSDQVKREVVMDIEAIALNYEKELGKVYFAGLPHIRVVMGKRVVDEMFIFIGLAIAVTSLLLYFFFRSFRIVVICNIVVFTAVIWSLGTIGLMGFKLSILMALIPPLMIIIGIPDCIYLLNNFHQEVKDHGNKIKALSRIIQKIGNATFMTNLTTAIGFSTFIFTNSDKLMEFGIAASLNIMLVFVLAITIIPIIFSYQKRPKERHLKHLEQKYITFIVDKLVDYTTMYRNRIYLITISAVVIAIFGAFKMEATGNLTSDLPESDPILKDIKFIQNNFHGVIPFEILVDYKSDGRKFDRGLLTKIETIQGELEKDTVFSKSISIVDFMKLLNMSYYGNDPSKYQLIRRQDMLHLKDYVDGFQEDMLKKEVLTEYMNSLKDGQSNYADSILLNYPQVALEIVGPSKESQDFAENIEDVEEVFGNDTLGGEVLDYLVFPSKFPSSEEILAFSSGKDLSKEVLATTDRIFPSSVSGLSLQEIADTTNTTYRIRLQALDLGSYEMDEIIERVSTMMDTVLNPGYEQAITYYEAYEEGKTEYIDSIFGLSNAYINNTTFNLAEGDEDKLFEFDLDPDLLASYYDKPEMKEALKEAIEHEKLDYIITGTSVIVGEGTKYLVYNMFTSIVMAIIVISFLMAILFQSWRMVLVSMVPNMIPLIITAGIMGYFAIPIKPSTLLVFSIALGISVDDTIHFLTRYRHALATKSYNQKACIIKAIRETGVSMLYTSLVLFAGFSMFTFSQFGGTKALGLLISLTLLVAMVTNLVLVPSLLLSIEKKQAEKAMRNPLISVYDEEIDVELKDLDIKVVSDAEKNLKDEFPDE